jgi:hypothetical protein
MATVKSYEGVREITDKDKVSPQAKIIVEALLKAKKALSREEIVAAIAPKLTTVQEPARIFGFYRPRLLEVKLMKENVTKVEAPVKEEKSKEVKVKKGAAKTAAA